MARRRPGYPGGAPRPSSISPNTSSMRLGAAGTACATSMSALQPLRRCASLHQAAFVMFALMAWTADGQMDPVEMQRQIQQEMGGGGGGGGAAPNRIGQLFSAAGAGAVAVARTAREHPRATAAATVAATTAVWAGTETRRSGLLVCRSPRISLFRPSDVYLSWVLETAADAPIAAPLRGVILSPLQDPDAEEEVEDALSSGVGTTRTEGSWAGKMIGKKHGRRAVGSARRRSSSSSSRRAEEEGVVGATELHAVLDKARGVDGGQGYLEETLHGQGKVKSVCAGVKVGTGLGLYHKFAQGLENLDVFDGRSDCELLAAESSTEDLGSTLGILTHSTVGTWSLSPVRVVLRRETSSVVPQVETSRRGGGRRRRRSTRSRRKEKRQSEVAEGETKQLHRQYTLGLSAVEGAGWSGSWVFRVTYDAETDEVWFQASLAQRKGAFGTTMGGDQMARVKRVNEDMQRRGNKHAAVLRTREEQFSRVSSLARSRARDAKELERDRILNPDKYKRVHRYVREDSHTTGGATARPARWGEERRRNDIRLK